MKILYIAPWIPSRIRPRSLSMLRRLCDDHEVHFLGLGGRNEIFDDLFELGLASCEVIQPKVLRALLRTTGALFSGRSLQAAYVADPRMLRAIRRAVAVNTPDVVHLNVVRSMAYSDQIGDTPVVFDLDEVRSEYYAQVLDTRAPAPLKMTALVEGRRLSALEAAAVERSHVVTVSSPYDARALGEKSVVVRSGIADRSPRQREGLGNAREREIIFVGRMSYAPNQIGVDWFVRHVWPGVLSKVPSARLRIVGERPPRRIRSHEGESISVLGRVDDVGDYYHRAAASIVPIRIGTGVQMKLIESLLHGVPTVTCREAAVRAGVSPAIARIATSPSEWIDACVSLLENVEMAEEMGERGREWAANIFGNEAISSSLDDAYAQVLGSPNAATN